MPREVGKKGQKYASVACGAGLDTVANRLLDLVDDQYQHMYLKRHLNHPMLRSVPPEPNVRLECTCEFVKRHCKENRRLEVETVLKKYRLERKSSMLPEHKT